jgi:hypothetical protein
VEDQPIHPYLDNQRFFDEQWVFATYHAAQDGALGRLDYFASPPAAWPAAAKHRAINHFNKFCLGKRYSIKAAEHLSPIFAQVNRMTDLGLSGADIRHVLFEPAIENVPFVNHWQRGMYQALAQTV